MRTGPLEARLVLVVAVEEAIDREQPLSLMCPRICYIWKIRLNIFVICRKRWNRRRYRRRLSPDFVNAEIEVVF
jgi:hypothetical protein